jgi:acyl-CoA thioesterase FadM
VVGDAPPFRTSFSVRIGDINYVGHKDIGGGAGLIMSEAYVSFKAEVFLDDEFSVTVTPAI